MSKSKDGIKNLIGSENDKSGENQTEPPSGDDKWIIIVLIIIVLIVVFMIPSCFPDYPKPNRG